MNEVDEITHAFASAFADALDVPVSATIPATLRAQSAYLGPDPDADFISAIGESATFARPTLTLDLVLIAPAYDYPERQAWLHARILDVRRATRAVDRPTIAGHPFPRFRSASIGLVDVTAGLLGSRCRFDPFQMKGA